MLASVTLEELSGHFHILNHVELLRRFDQALCLRMKRRNLNAAQTRDGTTFLEVVLGLPHFQGIPGHELEIVEVQIEREWRRKPGADELQQLMIGSAARNNWRLPDLSGYDCVPLYGWGPGNSADARPRESPSTQDREEFLLMVHPWGPDVLQLVEISECDAGAGDIIECSLCESSLHHSVFDKSLCLFHPGCFVERSDSTSPEDGFWECCNAAADAPGCMVEKHHLTADEVASDADDDDFGWRNEEEKKKE